MRAGSNPLKLHQAPASLPKLCATVITHLPNQNDYHRERLEIIQACLTSMRQNAGQDIPILVWDNGSCGALLNWLQDVYKPDYLMQSPNVGKIAARQAIMQILPTSIVAMTDDDMLFYPGWLRPQLDLLTRWPNVGSVTGYINRSAFRWGITSTLIWAQQNAILHKGQFIPKEWEYDYAVSVEIPPAEWLQRIARENDYLIEYQGMTAYATSHHCQFICYAERLLPLARISRSAMPGVGERQSDIDIDEAGYLRLATTQRLSRHMGNRWDAKLRMEVEDMHLA